MSYEIPQQLEYKEKIIFGLTFQQLLYALIFSPIALALLFKTPFPIAYRISLALIPSAFACIFIFTNIPKQVQSWIKWLTWRKFTIKDKKMKQFLNIDKIEGGVLLLK